MSIIIQRSKHTCFYLLIILYFGSYLSLKPFFYVPRQPKQPQLILISGPTGTGKSTFGMEVAISQGILKCISTDSIRQIMRTYVSDPALHRSSYSGDGDPIKMWMECSEVLQESIDGLVDDAIKRGTSLILEGVHVIPSQKIIRKWTDSGGVATGCVLTITDPTAHKEVLARRGEMTRKGAEQQMKAFARIRFIQEEMIRLAKLNNWIIIEQKLEIDPIDQITASLISSSNDISQQWPKIE